jgi:NADH-quinone oxidoreductase subunit N
VAGRICAEIVAGEIRVDRLAILGKLVVLGCGLAGALVFAARQCYKFWMLVTAMVFGAMLVLHSAGFASLFLGIEMLSLPAFALIVQEQGQGPASEGAFKYLVLSSVASALLLFGVSLAYGTDRHTLDSPPLPRPWPAAAPRPRPPACW